jgi:hypothetical protein
MQRLGRWMGAMFAVSNLRPVTLDIVEERRRSSTL